MMEMDMGKQARANTGQSRENPDELMTMKRRDFDAGIQHAYQTAFQQGLNFGMELHDKLFAKHMLIMQRVNSILYENGLQEQAFELFRMQMEPIYTKQSDNHDDTRPNPDQ